MAFAINCLKQIGVFIIGFTLMMQIMTPSLVYAGQGSPSLPKFLGSKEIRSGDLSSLTRWSALLKRFEAPLHSATPTSFGIAAWREAIHRFKGLSPHEQIGKVNELLNKVPYVNDLKRYGPSGYWEATPERFFREGGDCKDYALAKYASLRALGFPPEQLRIAVVIDKIKNTHHAVLVVNGLYVLDNQNRNIEFATNTRRYQPIFSMNSSGWWMAIGYLT
jgi:predicted transglutaminase-like cysteine proteinase